MKKTLLHESQALAHLRMFDPPPTDYVLRGLRRFVRTLQFIPPGTGTLLELGCDNYFSLLLHEFTDYEVRTHNLPDGGSGYCGATRFRNKVSGKITEFQRDQFNLESDPFPYPDNTIDVVVCAEVIEHLLHDPMAMLVEIHRVLEPNGAVVLTTPNLISWHAILKAIKGLSPLEFSCFMTNQEPPLLQHAKEYLPNEITGMLEASGFTIERLTTPYFLYAHEKLSTADCFLLLLVALWYPFTGRHPRLLRNRGPHIFVIARKTGATIDRYPSPVYRPS
jgi:SAM-dependent methyltransferase